MDNILVNLSMIGLAVLLVLVNGFFVAAEFALVKANPNRIDTYVAQNRGFAKIVRSQLKRLDAALSACQLGITLSSLGLGWIGEPALARIVEPLMRSVGVESMALIHGVSFAIAFSIITALHLTIGEQVPKMYAVKNPERVALWCAAPLKFFYVIAYPFLIILNKASNSLLRLVGVSDVNEHEGAHTGEEIRGMLAQAYTQGELSRNEHRMLDAVFEFDNHVVSEIMIPKRDVVFFEEGHSLKDFLQLISQTKHSRYPICQKSLDDVVGVIHIKDIVGLEQEEEFDLSSVIRPPQKIPEGMSVGKLLRLFQKSKQHMAFVVDEFSNVIGAVTLENVLEQIVGAVQDEFDLESPKIKKESDGAFSVDGAISVAELARSLQVGLVEAEAETLSGMITENLGQLPAKGDVVELGEVSAEVVEVSDTMATNVRVRIISTD